VRGSFRNEALTVLTPPDYRRNGDISRELARGKDGAVFLIDVGDKISIRDYADYSEW